MVKILNNIVVGSLLQASFVAYLSALLLVIGVFLLTLWVTSCIALQSPPACMPSSICATGNTQISLLWRIAIRNVITSTNYTVSVELFKLVS